jgi:SpoIID/LytB domain protein
MRPRPGCARHDRRRIPALVIAAALILGASVTGGAAGAQPAGRTAATSGSSAGAAAATSYYPVPSSGAWTVDGAGWGHGIGMSQWGTQGAALQGLTHQQILGFYYPGTTLGWVANPEIRVQLTSYSGSAIVFGRIGSEELTARDLATGRTQVLPPSSRYLLAIDANGLYLGQWNGTGWSTIPFQGQAGVAGPVEITGWSGTTLYDSDLSGAGKQYRGGMRMVRTASTKAQAVNTLSLDHYLRGVVPRESPSWWHAEALRSQAVAARSYALSVSSSGGAWDLCDTDQCQVYGGLATVAANGSVTSLEVASTSAAVEATSGVVVSYGNAPAFTQFSSSNGGYSVAGSKPYLVAQPDPYSGSAPKDTVSRWTRELSVSTVQAQCPAGGKLTSFEITGRDGKGPFGGRITAIRVNCTTGSTTITNRTTLKFGMLSNMWQPRAPEGSNPLGNWESTQVSASNVRVQGWAFDPDTANPIEIHAYVAGGGTNLGPAAVSRPDVEAAYPGFGAAHGFDKTLIVPPGTHDLCLYAINVGAGANTLLACRQVTVASDPVGQVEMVRNGSSPATIELGGWAFDPNTTDPIEVHAYVDGGGYNLGAASLARPDVGNAYPAAGSNHGFSASVFAAPGKHQVCVYAINVGAGSNVLLGCREVTVDGNPLGNLEVLSAGTRSVRVAGWAFDPDTSESIEVHVYVGAGGTNLGRATIPRPDVAQVYPGFGDKHGYDATIVAPSGVHDVCVYAINVGFGSHTKVNCARITIG